MQLMNSTNDHACHLRKHALYICLKLQLVKPAAKRQNHSGFYEARDDEVAVIIIIIIIIIIILL